MDPNHDIVPTLRMFDGLIMGQAADEIERLRRRIVALEATSSPRDRDSLTEPEPALVQAARRVCEAEAAYQEATRPDQEHYSEEYADICLNDVIKARAALRRER